MSRPPDTRVLLRDWRPVVADVGFLTACVGVLLKVGLIVVVYGSTLFLYADDPEADRRVWLRLLLSITPFVVQAIVPLSAWFALRLWYPSGKLLRLITLPLAAYLALAWPEYLPWPLQQWLLLFGHMLMQYWN